MAAGSVPGFAAGSVPVSAAGSVPVLAAASTAGCAAGSAADGYASAQAVLVAALTGTGPLPPGFDEVRIEAARKALLRKRAGETALQWPALAGALAADFLPRFSEWAAHRPTAGSVRDGWDLARDLASRSELPAPAVVELTEKRLLFSYRGRSAPRRRRAPRFARCQGRWLLQIGGRISTLGSR
ncbi:hypothetical protein ABIB25_003815 [Nakamurella sp. UYEF19]|uniref:hypothetical protein n=1 Tax=Nakamurella sp. UYEF19 TaxID=1756392 RepID=UPI0033925853